MATSGTTECGLRPDQIATPLARTCPHAARVGAAEELAGRGRAEDAYGTASIAARDFRRRRDSASIPGMSRLRVIVLCSLTACAAAPAPAPTRSAASTSPSASAAAPPVAASSAAASASTSARAPSPPPAEACPSGMIALGPGAFARAADRAGVKVGSYCLDRTEVTVEAFARCVAAGRCTEPDAVGAGAKKACNWRRPGSDAHPINCVDHAQATAYCAFATPGGRLPSEDEWEWAARGAERGSAHPWGDAPLTGRGCFDDDARDESPSGTCAVGAYPTGSSPQGIADLTGNVWEWTASAPSDDPSRAIDRGGGWLNGDAGMLAIGRRNAIAKGTRLSSLGFRCAR